MQAILRASIFFRLAIAMHTALKLVWFMLFEPLFMAIKSSERVVQRSYSMALFTALSVPVRDLETNMV